MNTDKKINKKTGKKINNKSQIADRKSKILAGCQGWNYDDWITKADGETVFYPRGTRSNQMLELYAKVFQTIEVDSTFYAIPKSSVIENWHKKTPEDFTFSLKLPQEITHEYGLREPSFPMLEEFCERVLLLKKKLGVVLVQLPPTFEASKENAQALRDFLAYLPKKIRFAIEFRSRDWFVDWTFEELSKNKVAICATEGNWIPREQMFEAMQKPTAEFVYVRFMGERDLQTFDRVLRAQDANLQMWKEEIAKLKVKQTFIYFSNFYEGHAPASANKLKELFGQETIEASSLESQEALF